MTAYRSLRFGCTHFFFINVGVSMGIVDRVSNVGKTKRHDEPPISLRVLKIEDLSLNIRRFVFLDETHSLLKKDESGYLKLMFQNVHGEYKLRSYTIRAVVEESHHIMVDFVLHGTEGPASAWALNAQVDDVISAYGPGPAKLVNNAMDWFFVIGDMTALPAIAVNLRQLPASATGYALIHITDESDIQMLDAPEGIDIEWVLASDRNKVTDVMLEKVKNKGWLQGTPYVWIATEFTSAVALRGYFRSEKSIGKNAYVSSYWKLGESDEGNKKAKRTDGGF